MTPPVLSPGFWMQTFLFGLAFLLLFAVLNRACDWLVERWRAWRLARDLARQARIQRAALRWRRTVPR